MQCYYQVINFYLCCRNTKFTPFSLQCSLASMTQVSILSRLRLTKIFTKTTKDVSRLSTFMVLKPCKITNIWSELPMKTTIVIIWSYHKVILPPFWSFSTSSALLLQHCCYFRYDHISLLGLALAQEEVLGSGHEQHEARWRLGSAWPNSIYLRLFVVGMLLKTLLYTP